MKACILPRWTRGSERRNKDYRDFTAFTAFYRVYLTVKSILELVIDALPKNNYRGIPGITWELPRDRGSPTFFGNLVTGKSKPSPVQPA